jgi:hypothetical protein
MMGLSAAPGCKDSLVFDLGNTPFEETLQNLL